LSSWRVFERSGLREKRNAERTRRTKNSVKHQRAAPLALAVSQQMPANARNYRDRFFYVTAV